MRPTINTPVAGGRQQLPVLLCLGWLHENMGSCCTVLTKSLPFPSSLWKLLSILLLPLGNILFPRMLFHKSGSVVVAPAWQPALSPSKTGSELTMIPWLSWVWSRGTEPIQPLPALLFSFLLQLLGVATRDHWKEAGSGQRRLLGRGCISERPRRGRI